MFFASISRKVFHKVFFPVFLRFFPNFHLDFFPVTWHQNLTFPKRLESFAKNRQTYGVFSGFLTLIFFYGQTERKRNFSKKIEKVRLKSKIVRWFFCFSIFVGEVVSRSKPLNIFIQHNLRFFRRNLIFFWKNRISCCDINWP